MNKRTKFLLLSALLLLRSTVFAQEAEMADAMRADGKIYVLVAIILVIFFGLIGFLVLIERKVSNLEKRLK